MATSTQPHVFKTVIGPYPHTEALKSGEIAPKGVQFEHYHFDPVHDAFQNTVRKLEYEISELAVSTYFLAKAHSKPLTAIPVVLNRNFHHGAVYVNHHAGIKGPKDLNGRRVGIRSYGQTTGLWARGILQHEYGVDLKSITWVLVEEEHIQEFRPEDGIARIERKVGGNLAKMLETGEIDAAIGVSSGDHIEPLVPDAAQAQAAWYKRTGVYPVNHTVVIRDDVLKEHPWLPGELMTAFNASKQHYLDRLKPGASSAEDQRFLNLQKIVGPDPVPHGLKANWPGFDTLMGYAVEQWLIPRKFTKEELFAPGTLDT